MRKPTPRQIGELRPGDAVVIFSDPLTRQNPEGPATLVRQYRPDDGDCLSMWIVCFVDDPGSEYLRTICAS